MTNPEKSGEHTQGSGDNLSAMEYAVEYGAYSDHVHKAGRAIIGAVDDESQSMLETPPKLLEFRDVLMRGYSLGKGEAVTLPLIDEYLPEADVSADSVQKEYGFTDEQVKRIKSVRRLAQVFAGGTRVPRLPGMLIEVDDEVLQDAAVLEVLEAEDKTKFFSLRSINRKSGEKTLEVIEPGEGEEFVVGRSGKYHTALSTYVSGEHFAASFDDAGNLTVQNFQPMNPTTVFLGYAAQRKYPVW